MYTSWQRLEGSGSNIAIVCFSSIGLMYNHQAEYNVAILMSTAE